MTKVLKKKKVAKMAERRRIQKEIDLTIECIRDEGAPVYIRALIVSVQGMVNASPIDYQRYHGQLSNLIGLFCKVNNDSKEEINFPLNGNLELNEYINALRMSLEYMVNASSVDFKMYHGQLSNLIELFRAIRELNLLERNL